MRNLIIVLSSLCLMSGSCDDFVPDQYYFIRIRNNSSQDVITCGSYILPNTLLPQDSLATTKVLSGKSNVILDRQLNDPKLERFKTEKATIFIISEDVFSSLSWDSLRKSNNILKKYEINEKDLEEMGWEINYP